MFNWEELGKIDSSLLRTMRHITFGNYTPSYDGAYFGKKKKSYGGESVYLHQLDSKYKIFDVKPRTYEEWPSSKWNYQDKFPLKSIKSMKVSEKDAIDAPVSGDEATPAIKLSKTEIKEILISVDGIGNKKAKRILENYNKTELVEILDQEPSLLLNIKGVTGKIVEKLSKVWDDFINNYNNKEGKNS